MSNLKDTGRRDFIKLATGTALSGAWAPGAQASPATSQVQHATKVEVGAPRALSRYIQLGEPVELLGRRMTFMSYQFILPAKCTWRAGTTRPAGVMGTAGLWDAQRSVADAATGIRVAARPAHRSDRPYELAPRKSWEANGVSLCDLAIDRDMEIHWAGNILFDSDDGYFKAWGTCSSQGTEYRCYLQSKDFVNWERPELGVLAFDGSRANNLIQVKKDNLFGCVFKDPSTREERWKWMLEGEANEAQLDWYRKNRPEDVNPNALRFGVHREVPPGYLILAVRGGTSPDGFRWTTLPEPLVIEHSDTLHTAYYDEKLRRYVAYFRQYAMPRYSSRAPASRYSFQNWKMGRRSIGRAETDDFRKFPLSKLVLEPGPEIVGPSDGLYTNCHTFVPGTKDQHVFFPTVWHQAYDNCSVAAVVSMDGEMMHWLPGNPVLNTASFGAWDGGCLFALPELMELPDGDWVLPYIGFDVPHKYPRHGAFKYGLGLARWPKGRLAGVEAAGQGQFTTYACVPPGRRIRINALTTRGGGVRVELANLHGKVVPGRSFAECHPIVGDQPRALVTWEQGEDIGVPDGTPIRLRFEMQEASVFFVDFGA